ncbi:MAG: TlpA family protein disulfide reductase [Thermomicrobia bacterium]|nr:TlpA family protein disulfide reductase [Thermomicrobia bacterium]MCA1725314.1 TlpA family protein disulfide reductase [Thermomicrobia bacterium]
MAEDNHGTLTTDALPPLRMLPRGVQVGVGLLLAVAIILGIALFNQQNGGAGLTDPGRTVPRVGDRLAALPLTMADGTPFDMATLAGHPVWINFWAAWCGPCKAEMPDLQTVYAQERAAHPDLILLLVNTADVRKDGLKYYQDLHMSGTLVFNDGSRDVGPYRITNFPTHLMVDRTGVVQRVLQQSLDPETARQEVQHIVG